MRGPLENIWQLCSWRLSVCCFSVHLPELSATKARMPLTRALQKFRRNLIACGVENDFGLFQLPKFDAQEESGRFRVLVYADGNIIQSGEKIRGALIRELKRQFPRYQYFVTINTPPSQCCAGAMLLNGDNFQEVYGWLYHYLADSDSLFFRCYNAVS
jgi:hypothetical protein